MSFAAAEDMLLPPEGQVVTLAGISISLSGEPHPVWLEFSDAIEANWIEESAANAALFDGTVLLAGRVRLVDGHLHVEVHRTRFATLLWWRQNYANTPFVHAFCMAFPVTKEGHIVAIRMAPHTSNAGRIYCAAGTLDDNDLDDDGCVDAEANMARELLEETGLSIDRGQALNVLRVKGRLVIFKRAELGLSRQAVEQTVQSHMAVDEEKEIDGLFFIENDEIRSENFATFMQPIITWIFEHQSHTRMD